MSSSLKPLRPVRYLTSHDLQKLSGDRSHRSCCRDMQYLRTVLNVPKGIPGLPLYKYAAYADIEPELILDSLGVKRQAA